MKIKFSTVLILFVLSTIFIFCQRSKKEPVMVHPKDFGIDIYVGGGIRGPSFQAKLFTPELLDNRRRGFKVNTLYILKGHRGGEPDTFKIKFNKDEIDSLYRLSYTYLSESYKSVQVR